jgi:hypothetical protein
MHVGKARISAAFAITLASGLIGCGSSSRRALTHSQLVAQANAICARAMSEGERLPPPAQGVAGFSEYPRRIEELTAIMTPTVHQLAQLTPPASDVPTYRRFVRGMSEIEQVFTRLADGFKNRDRSAIQSALTGAVPTNPTLDAERLGITECGHTSELAPHAP